MKPADAPRASYIPEYVWRIRAAKLQLKAATLHHGQNWKLLLQLAVAAVACWRRSQVSQLWGWFVKKQQLLHGIFAAAVKFATMRSKAGIRQAKNAFLQSQGYEPPTGANHLLANLKRLGSGSKRSVLSGVSCRYSLM